MNKINIDVWGRQTELEVVYDCYKNEDVLESQKNAFKVFYDNSTEILNNAKTAVEQYCVTKNEKEIGGKNIDNIFRFIKPKTVYIPRVNTDVHRVAILCAYKFNPDDGLAIVFENEKLLKIGTENIV